MKKVKGKRKNGKAAFASTELRPEYHFDYSKARLNPFASAFKKRRPTLKITICPMCGSRRIKLRTKNWQGNFQGQVYFVPNLTYYQCEKCDESVYDGEAMRRIRKYSPAFKKARTINLFARAARNPQSKIRNPKLS